jgi:hypothetical protein
MIGNFHYRDTFEKIEATESLSLQVLTGQQCIRSQLGRYSCLYIIPLKLSVGSLIFVVGSFWGG